MPRRLGRVGRRRPWRAVRRYFGARLHRRLFLWFGVAIVLSMVVATTVGSVLGPQSRWRGQVVGVERFAEGRFEHVWDRPAERAELVSSLERDLGLRVRLLDARKRPLPGSPELPNECRFHQHEISVRRQDVLLGYVQGCMPRGGPHEPGAVAKLGFVLAMFSGVGTLWGATWLLSRRLTRSLSDLVRVSEELGAGQLSSRAQLARGDPGEVGELAASLDRMAGRIERQLQDQKELLAVVSHEIRTPLARLLVLTELLREPGSEARRLQQLGQIEEEVQEIDRLVGELLASSRLDFAQLETRELSAHELAERALERAGLGPELLSDESDGARVRGDATLLGRALANLLDNARRHAGGATGLRVRVLGDRVELSVVDAGPGLPAQDLERVFDAFCGRSTEPARARETSLGLGLALVQRIAVAHSGHAWARNRQPAGAEVGLTLPRATSAPQADEPGPG